MPIQDTQLSLLKEDAILSSLFLKPQILLSSVTESMKLYGFREDKPIVVDESTQVIVDGHIRYLAAKEVGIENIPVYFRSFSNENDRLEFALSEQRDRRNLTDGNILQCIKKLDELDYDGLRNQKEGEHAYTKIAEKIGCTIYKVQIAKKVLNSQDEKLITSILSDEITLHAASKKIKTIGLTVKSSKKKNEYLANMALELILKAIKCTKKETSINESVNKVKKAIKSSSPLVKLFDVDKLPLFNESERDKVEKFEWYLVGTDK